jgi:uncharacterized membrane protein
MVIAPVAVIVLLALVLIVRHRAVARDPDQLRVNAEAEIELHRINRQLEADAVKHSLRRDQARLRRQVHQELQDVASSWPAPGQSPPPQP